MILTSASISELLRDELGRKVTICLSNEHPSTWIERDVKFRIYPALEEGYSCESVRIKHRRPYPLNSLRKCWNTVQSFQHEESSTDLSQAGSDPQYASLSTRSLRIMDAVFEIFELFYPV